MLLRDNVYGTVEEDAQRRDFTINAMYYNIADYSIHDYANGLKDLEDGVIRLMGDPETRYREDPVRMLRAIRFAAKLSMTICPKTAAPIKQLSPLLLDIPAARLFEESLKLLQSGDGLVTYDMLREYNLFQQLFPLLAEYFTDDQDSNTEQMIELVLSSTDRRLNADQRVNSAFVFAAVLWYPLVHKAEQLCEENGMNYYDAIMEASNIILDKQVKSIAIPRRFTTTIRDIWQLQLRLPRRSGKRAFALYEQQKFRAGFDFLEMRAEIEQGQTKELAQWWTEFQNVDRNQKQKMVQQLGQRRSGSNRRRKPNFRRKNTKADS